ncbi:MAG: carbohydrate ABC transporter permease [Clostridia bacterium]|nr:carbohydrate ABC transporter permease [Clostridia bacterium]
MTMRTRGEKIFGIFNAILLTAIAMVCIYPFIYILAVSLSDAKSVNMGAVWLLPKGINLNSYSQIVHKEGIWTAYLNSFFYMFMGTAVSMALTTLGAYALSKKRLVGHRFLNLFVVFTMWFNAGMIPMYLNFKNMGMLDNRWAIIFGFAINTYNFVILRTYFANVPQALEEAAKIDGASDFKVLLKIYLPLAVPSLATVALFYAVERWNSYFWPMILLKSDSKIPLQVVLKKMVVDMSSRMDSLNYGRDMTGTSEDGFIYSTMVIAMIPMLILYPFIQRYFVKGVMVGSVKG